MLNYEWRLRQKRLNYIEHFFLSNFNIPYMLVPKYANMKRDPTQVWFKSQVQIFEVSTNYVNKDVFIGFWTVSFY